MESKAIGVRAMSPEQRSQFIRDAIYAAECQQTFGRGAHECTEVEIRYLQENHRPCPWEGPHTDDCNLMECMVALARKKRKQEGSPDYEPICACGKNLQEHTVEEVFACLYRE